MATSVLLVADQKAGRMPEVCVLTGERTEHVARVSAVTWGGARWLLWVPGVVSLLRLVLRRPQFTVTLPVSERIWRSWRQRTVTAVVVAVFGVTMAVAGLIKDAPLLVVVGAIAAAIAVVRRVRATRDYWVTCTWKPDVGRIVVQPTHRAFDDEAKRLFLTSLQ